MIIQVTECQNHGPSKSTVQLRLNGEMLLEAKEMRLRENMVLRNISR
jgi:hypothetical protein